MDIFDVKGIGPKTVLTLNKIGIYTVDDLVNYYPYRYDYYSIGKLENISNYSLVKAKVVLNANISYIRKNFTKLNFSVECENKIIERQSKIISLTGA